MFMKSLQNAHACQEISKVPVLPAFKKMWNYTTNELGERHNNTKSKVKK
jgi:hypothetical protein